MTYATISVANDYDAISSLLQRTLDAVVAVFDDNGIELPTRRYIHVGAIALDCEQVTVQLIQAFLGTPGTPPGAATKCDNIRSVTMRVNVVRKAPALGARGGIPTAEQLADAATVFARDMWLLMDVPARVNDLGGSVIVDADPIDPQGGYSGAGLNLTIAIP